MSIKMHPQFTATFDFRPFIVTFMCALLMSSVRADCYTRDGMIPQSLLDRYLTLVIGILAQDSEFYRKGAPELVSCENGTNNCCLRSKNCGSNLLCYLADGHIRVLIRLKRRPSHFIAKIFGLRALLFRPYRRLISQYVYATISFSTLNPSDGVFPAGITICSFLLQLQSDG